MDVYVGKDEQALRKLLDGTTDYGERRKIRTAIRELKKASTNNNNNNNVTQKSTISVNIDGGTSQTKTESVESTTTTSRQEKNEGEGGQSNENESRVTKTRYRRRMEMEAEEKEKAGEKEQETKIRLEDIEDEEVLSKMLKETTVYEDRKKIRMAMKELRNRKASQAQSSPVSGRTRSSATHIEVQRTGSPQREEQKSMVTDSGVKTAKEDEEKKEDVINRKLVSEDEPKTNKTDVNIDDIKDENVLKQMLKDTEDFELKKKIRVALREIRKKTRENAAKEEETKEVTNGATHTTEMTLQVGNKELEKRNGEVQIAEVAVNKAVSSPEVTVNKAVSSPKVMPKMVIRTHSFKKLEKFDAPEVAKKQGSVVSTERIELNGTAKKDKNLWDATPTSEKKAPAKEISKDTQTNPDVAKNVRTEITTSVAQPKMESPRPTKTAIEIPVQRDDSRGKWNTPKREEARKKSFEEIEDLAELESLLLKTKRADERLEIRAHMRELKKRKTEGDQKKAVTKVEDVKKERPKNQDDTRKKETTVVPVTDEDVNKNTENSMKVDTIEERPDPNTKITTTVMRLKDPNKEGEEVKEQTVVEQRTDSAVKKMTRTITLKTNGESKPQMSVEYNEEPPKPVKTVVSRTMVTRETTDDYSSCYTSEEEEETVVKTDAKGKMYTSKTRKIIHRMQVTDLEKRSSPESERKSQSSKTSTGKYRQRKSYESDTDSSDDELDGGMFSRKAVTTPPSKKEPETKGVATAKFKTQATTRLQNQSSQPLKDKNTVQEKQTEEFRNVQGRQEPKEVTQEGTPSSKEELDKEGTKMAPTQIEELEDEGELERLLDDTTDFDERRKIRTRLREVRRKRREERDRKMAQREKEREQEKKDRMAAADKKYFDIVKGGGPRFSGSVSTTTSSNTSKTTSTDSNANTSKTETTKKEDAEKSNTTKTVVAKKDEPESKSVTKTTEQKTEGGTTMKKTTTVTETKDAGSKSLTVEEKTLITSGDGISSSMSVTKTSSSSSSTGGTIATKKMTKFEEELEARRKAREDKRDMDTKKFKEESVKRQQALMEKKKMEAMSTRNKRSAIMDKFGGAAKSGPPVGGGGGPRMQVQNANTIKQMLLDWCKVRTQGYANCEVTNFSSSWANGMAFCALIHRYFPDAFDYNTLNPKNRKYNFDLAFNTAEKCADISPLLETEDMLMMGNRPDWKCVFCYVQSLYRNLSKRD